MAFKLNRFGDIPFGTPVEVLKYRLKGTINSSSYVVYGEKVCDILLETGTILTEFPLTEIHPPEETYGKIATCSPCAT